MPVPAGLQRLKLLDQLQSCNAVTEELSSVRGFAQLDFLHNYYINTFSNPTRNGDKCIAGPMTVLQGTVDKPVTYPMP